MRRAAGARGRPAGRCNAFPGLPPSSGRSIRTGFNRRRAAPAAGSSASQSSEPVPASRASGEIPSPPSTSAPDSAPAEVGCVTKGAAAGRSTRTEVRKVEVIRIDSLGVETSLRAGVETLRAKLREMRDYDTPKQRSGILRLEVVVPPHHDLIEWLQDQARGAQDRGPAGPLVYFSPRSTAIGDGLVSASSMKESGLASEVATACLGSSCLWKGVAGRPFDREAFNRISRFLSERSRQIRAFGGTRFNSSQMPSLEWEAFGSFFFLIPAVELTSFPSHSLLSCTVAWDNGELRAEGEQVASVHGALGNAEAVLASVECSGEGRPAMRCRVDVEVTEVSQSPTERDWATHVNSVLDELRGSRYRAKDGGLEGVGGREAAGAREQGISHAGEDRSERLDLLEGLRGASGSPRNLEKLVLARRTRMHSSKAIDPLHLLSCLRDQDPKGYQFCLALPGIKGQPARAFFGSTPERLYAREGGMVTSEAVAATRRSGFGGCDLTEDLLKSEKDHNEFVVVRDAVTESLGAVCSSVSVEVDKEVLRHVDVQHLYGRMCGHLSKGRCDYDLITSLHPTPAVAGYPSPQSLDYLSRIENFDRGFYSGPFGWMSGPCSEFAVAIRSSLVKGPGGIMSRGVARRVADGEADIGEMMLYAGVGIVRGSSPESEWNELDLKVQQFTKVVGVKSTALSDQPNVNAAVAACVVEELCRHGVRHFCIAPGSRSTPLVLAAARHPRTLLTTCIDERSLGFFAAGLAKSGGVPAAVITTSGTAVANLLPAVVEASESRTPLLLLTADRPPEMQGAGANQTTDQAHIYGTHARWFRHIPAPSGETSLGMVLTSVSEAMRRAMGSEPGPVHLNFELREPLAPTEAAWDRAMISARVASWEAGSWPFLSNAGLPTSARGVGGLEEVADSILAQRRGLVVCGTCLSRVDRLAAVKLAGLLRWPLVPDVSSGLKPGSGWEEGGDGVGNVSVVSNLGHVLLHEGCAQALRPDCVVRLGREGVSKRVNRFVEQSCEQGSSLFLVGEGAGGRDPGHTACCHVQVSPAALAEAVRQRLAGTDPCPPTACVDYAALVRALDRVAGDAIERAIYSCADLTEPLVARKLARHLPVASALFLGNSMPIRDMDMYGSARRGRTGGVGGGGITSLITEVGSSRGASGIDGVLSAAAGYAEALCCPATLLVGDVSFAHDTNGLSFLAGAGAHRRAALTTIVVNNGGGHIFQMLPVAKAITGDELEQLFLTPPGCNAADLCAAHGVPYQRVTRGSDLMHALRRAWASRVHNVVEVVVDPAKSIALRGEVQQRVRNCLGFVHETSLRGGTRGATLVAPRIDNVSVRRMSYPVDQRFTTGACETRRRVLQIEVSVSGPRGDGLHRGTGEISPLSGLHSESLREAESQALCLANLLTVRQVPFSAACLDGGLEGWLEAAGVSARALFPSVRWGVECALAEALAHTLGRSFCDVLGIPRCSAGVSAWGEGARFCGLLPSVVSDADMVRGARELTSRGYSCIKVKVGRGRSPAADAALIRTICEQVSEHVTIRCDANRAWTLEEALTFARAAEGCRVEFLEEPLRDASQLEAFCTSTGMRIALDESLEPSPLRAVVQYSAALGPSLAAAVIKPDVIGGVEASRALVDICCSHGIMPVVSSSFQGGEGLSKLAELAQYADAAYAESEGVCGPVTHGLGTIDWNGQDPSRHLVRVIASPLAEAVRRGGTAGLRLSPATPAEVAQPPYAAGLEASVLLCSALEGKMVPVAEEGDGFMTLQKYCPGEGSASDASRTGLPLIFLHGFLGSVADWAPVMAGLAARHPCYAVSLPGHFPSRGLEARETSVGLADGSAFESVARSLRVLLGKAGVRRCALVGYSMGARLSLELALGDKGQGWGEGELCVAGLVSISGGAGIKDPAERQARSTRDEKLSRQLEHSGVAAFLHSWYRQPLFATFRVHPRFETLRARRERIHQAGELACALRVLSPGLQDPHWERLRSCRMPLLVLAGGEDEKYVAIGRDMASAARESRDVGEYDVRLQVVPGAGHALHLECPELISPAISRFADQVDRAK